MNTIKIGPIDFQLDLIDQIDPDAELCISQINVDAEQILLNSALGPQMRMVVVWHEVIHGILHQAGFTEHEEDKIEALSYGIVSALQDNEILRMNK
jgi:Zn-dependent peptidase ImmA (M78 family)